MIEVKDSMRKGGGGGVGEVSPVEKEDAPSVTLNSRAKKGKTQDAT